MKSSKTIRLDALAPHTGPERSAMGLAEANLVPRQEPDHRLAENERLINQARQERLRHETRIREAERRIRTGLGIIRRATLRVVSP